MRGGPSGNVVDTTELSEIVLIGSRGMGASTPPPLGSLVPATLQGLQQRDVAVAGLKEYVREVKESQFPDDEHSYSVADGVLEEFQTLIEKRKQH